MSGMRRLGWLPAKFTKESSLQSDTYIYAASAAQGAHQCQR